MTKAKYVECDAGGEYHEMLDYCYGCAPFWKNIAICPQHESKLTTKGYCRTCKKHYQLGISIEEVKATL